MSRLPSDVLRRLKTVFERPMEGQPSRTASSFFVDRLDGRGPWARRLRDIIALHVTDQGGPDGPPNAGNDERGSAI